MASQYIFTRTSLAAYRRPLTATRTTLCYNRIDDGTTGAKHSYNRTSVDGSRPPLPSYLSNSRRFYAASNPRPSEKQLETEIADEIPQAPAYTYQKKDKVIDNEDPALKLQHSEGGKWMPSEGRREKPTQQVADFADEASGWYPESRDMANDKEAFEKMKEEK